jgi:hypothetical protein
MRVFRLALPLVVLGLALPLTVAAEKSDPSWEKLKSLVGEWEGTVGGKPTRATYALVSNGTALMETLETDDATQMVTVYHPDGSSLLMTHYCAMGNQPRMRSKGLKDGRIDFTYIDATNLKAPDEHRMTRVIFSFPDASHLVQDWTSKEGGKDVVSHFELARRK